MRTRIISAFPGTGKTTYYENSRINTLDSDSSLFSWVTQNGEKVRNPLFPNNYIEHIKSNIGRYEFILVSTHKEVREALLNACLHFYLVYPNIFSKELYLSRYYQRGSSQKFMTLLDEQWAQWIFELDNCDCGCEQIIMNDDQYLEDVIRNIVASEE